MQSKKMETIIKRIKTLNKEELKQLTNEIEAEIMFRDIKDRSLEKVLGREFKNV